MKTSLAALLRGLCCLLLLWVSCVAPAAAQQSRRVLFVGNSYTQVNNLPQLVVDVAASMGDVLVFASNTPGGCTFQQHCTNASMSLIRQGGWDAVVLQEQSQYPSFPQQQVENEVFPFAARLVDSIYAANPCAEPMFYMTWGRQNGDQQNAQYFPVLGTYEGMDSMLCLRYTYMAAANDASLCPVGRVWRALRQQHPAIGLYQSDGSHPSLAGSYAAACAFYVSLFHRDPLLISYDGELPPEVAAAIRAVVAQVVYDNLSQYLRPYPQAAFVFDTLSSTVVRFSSRADHAASLLWSFGDGDTLSSADAEVIHHYADTGSYRVLQVARRHCLSDSAHAVVRLSLPAQVGLSDAPLLDFSVFPNPAADRLVVLLPSAVLDDVGARVEVLSADGRLVCSAPLSSGRLSLSLAALPSGCAVVRLVSSLGVSSKLLIKK